MKTPEVKMFEELNMTVIPVIASFDTEGNILPLYIRILGESYQINNCERVYKRNFAHDYKVSIIKNNYRVPIEITYHPKYSFWTIENKYLKE